MIILVQDTKHPNKDPFETSEAGFKGLQDTFGKDRYVRVQKEIITPDKVEIIKVAPVKTTTQGTR